MYRSKTFTLLLLVVAQSLFAQTSPKYTLSGAVTDGATGETLIGVTVRSEDGAGAVTNEYGFYSLTLPAGTHTVAFQYIGYNTVVKSVQLNQSRKMDVSLGDNSTSLGEVEIKASKTDEQVSKPLMGVEKLSMAEVKSLPVLFGERDILKTIQLLPGVKSAGEGNAGFYVRGGAADQNLILLDEAPVYNASHLLGFFSTFNADAIKDATLYKGSAPAQYGGRISSVLDIKMNDGNNQDYKVSGGIGVISSKLNVEGPIQKGKSSFLVTGRRTYLDLFLKASPDSSINSTELYFYDLNAKVNYQLDARNRLFVSGYFGRDVLAFGNGSFGINWGNATATVRWNHLFSDKLFSNTSLIYSSYDNNIAIQSGANDFQISSRIRDWNLKQDFQWFPNSRNTVKYGFQSIYHTITPSSIDASETSSLNSAEAQKRYGLESAAFVTHDWQATDKLNVLYGLRISDFAVLGGGDFYTYDAEGTVLTTTTYQNGELVKNYLIPEPRVAVSYQLAPRAALKFGYTRNTQYLHLLSNSTASNPTDLWMPTTNNVEPEIADQVSVGWFRNFGKESAYEFSVETYYKSMQNQIDYRNGAEVQGNPNPEAELLYGSGRAYGVELLLKKKAGKLTGWLSYTLARTERKIPGINNNTYYPAKQDRTHDLSIVGMYQLSPRWQLSGNWVFYTGNAVTFPSGKYEVNGATTFLYTERNGYRMPDYHRLDVGATYLAKKTKRFESEWSFSAYNLYNRKNAYTITFQDSETNPGTTEALRTALFGIVPSVAWNFKF
jgi:CarboxypepD_reg-like domain/TonB-dependent Receptor Plug Domain